MPELVHQEPFFKMMEIMPEMTIGEDPMILVAINIDLLNRVLEILGKGDADASADNQT